MITAILTMVVTYGLFCDKLPQPLLIAICAVLGVFLARTSRRNKHTQAIPIDVLAQVSRLKTVNPSLKFWTLLAMIIICVASRNPYTGVFLLVSMMALAVFAAVPAFAALRLSDAVLKPAPTPCWSSAVLRSWKPGLLGE